MTKTAPNRHGQQLTSLQKTPTTTTTTNIKSKTSSKQLKDHFSTKAEKLPITNPKSNTLIKLKELCYSRNIQSKLGIPLMAVTDVYNALKHLKQSGTRDLDGHDTKILRLAAPLITKTLTYVFNLCLMKSTFPNAFKIAKVIPLYKNLETSQTNQTTYQLLLRLSWPNHSKIISINTFSST